MKLLPALLLPLSFAVKLTVATLFYSICLPLKLIVFNFSSTLLLVRKIINRIKYLVLWHINIIKPGWPSYLHCLLSFPSYRATRSSFVITLSRTSIASFLKIANLYFYHYCCFVEKSTVWSTPHRSARHFFTYIKLACLWSFNLSLLNKL